MGTHLLLLLTGLAIGSIYALIAIGFSVIFKASHTLNFAHLALMVLGGFVVFHSTQIWGLNFWVGLVIAMAVNGLVAAALYMLIAAPLVGRSMLAVLIATLGANIVLETGIVSYPAWSTDIGVEVGSPWGNRTVGLLDGNIFLSHLWVLGISTTIVALLYVILQRSRWGLLFRAIAEDQEAAAAQGIKVKVVLVVVWAAAAVLAAVAGAFVGTFPRLISPASVEFALRSLPAVVIGGFDSINGAIIGGALVGIAEVYAAGYAPDALGNNFHLIIAFLLMFAVLMIRPHGLFGSPEIRRV